METSISTGHESPRETQERSNVHEDRKTARLVRAIQELSLARDLPAIQRILKMAAREMMSSDGATIVLLEDARVREKMEQESLGRLEGLARFERPKKVALLEGEFTVANGILTPSLKVKRRVIEERFSGVIEGLYAEGGGRDA